MCAPYRIAAVTAAAVANAVSRSLVSPATPVPKNDFREGPARIG
jgi:hypothetical protein